MKNLIVLAGLVLSAVLCSSFVPPLLGYNQDHVQISTVLHEGKSYTLLTMNRGASGKRIKAKYFAAKDYNGTTVPNRYKSWSQGKNIICATSGTYMSDHDADKGTPLGLTIDQGVMVNKNMEDWDALVIVYATGGVVVSDLDNKDLVVQGGTAGGKKLDIRGNSWDRSSFIQWCADNEATVFQTHLLAYKNQLTISANANTRIRERRMLAAGENDEGDLVHCIIHSPDPTTLYEGARRVLKFLNEFEEIEPIFMINLDTGSQDVFDLYNADGMKITTISGSQKLSSADNLLVYYYD